MQSKRSQRKRCKVSLSDTKESYEGVRMNFSNWLRSLLACSSFAFSLGPLWERLSRQRIALMKVLDFNSICKQITVPNLQADRKIGLIVGQPGQSPVDTGMDTPVETFGEDLRCTVFCRPKTTGLRPATNPGQASAIWDETITSYRIAFQLLLLQRRTAKIAKTLFFFWCLLQKAISQSRWKS